MEIEKSGCLEPYFESNAYFEESEIRRCFVYFESFGCSIPLCLRSSAIVIIFIIVFSESNSNEERLLLSLIRLK